MGEMMAAEGKEGIEALVRAAAASGAFAPETKKTQSDLSERLKEEQVVEVEDEEEEDDDDGENSREENDNRRKGAWSAEEDNRLRSVLKFLSIQDDAHYSKWSTVSSYIPGRSAKQCRERWCYNLDPSICKDPWTPREDNILLETHKVLGNRWAKIASQLPGRTENSVKTRYKSIIRAKKREWTAEEDETILSMQRKFGCKWDLIAAKLENRTKNAVKTRYRQLFRASRWSPGESKSDSQENDLDINAPFGSRYRNNSEAHRRFSETSTTSSVSTVPAVLGPSVMFQASKDSDIITPSGHKQNVNRLFSETDSKKRSRGSLSLLDLADSQPQSKRASVFAPPLGSSSPSCSTPPLYSLSCVSPAPLSQSSVAKLPVKKDSGFQRPSTTLLGLGNLDSLLSAPRSSGGTSPNSDASPTPYSTSNDSWPSPSPPSVDVKPPGLGDIQSLLVGKQQSSSDNMLMQFLIVEYLKKLQQDQQQQQEERARLARVLPQSNQDQLNQMLLNLISKQQQPRPASSSCPVSIQDLLASIQNK